MNLSYLNLKKKISEKRAVKIITGLNNFKINEIIKVAKAAELGGATYLDIAADPVAVQIIKSITHLPVCVSSINPLDLHQCVLAGADMVEVGNFDCFYENNIFFSQYEVLKLTQEIQQLLNNVEICVTIPHYLLLSEQIDLVASLKNLGISLIQTEGLSTKNCVPSGNDFFISDFTHRASSALSSSYAITNSVDINVIASSGINAISAPIAISYGASAVGIGSALSSFSTIHQMANYINEIVCSLSCNNEYQRSTDHLFLNIDSTDIIEIEAKL
uniref:hypothetical protein Ycf23 n=1 Tax=Gloiopeltis furcata TaxID=42017 RepID=UPI0028D05D2E|nr:hypothetical protein Ycf23 [Gloiopeltis furcata]WMP13850.1 hypothetical protein Ycf23 [Gloiopeltis furcata]